MFIVNSISSKISNGFRKTTNFFYENKNTIAKVAFVAGMTWLTIALIQENTKGENAYQEHMEKLADPFNNYFNCHRTPQLSFESIAEVPCYINDNDVCESKDFTFSECKNNIGYNTVMNTMKNMTKFIGNTCTSPETTNSFLTNTVVFLGNAIKGFFA